MMPVMMMPVMMVRGLRTRTGGYAKSGIERTRCLIVVLPPPNAQITRQFRIL
jgi:hypothetical protein